MSHPYLKITQKGWEGYTGHLGPYVEFVNGVSIHPVPRNIADPLTGLVAMVEVDAEGNEQVAGIAHRLVEETAARAPIITSLTRQTASEKKAEAKLEAVKRDTATIRFYTGAELESIASEKGIAGIREIAEGWNVKHRSIVVLIQMILDAQAKVLAERNEKMIKASAPEPSYFGSDAFAAEYEVGTGKVTLGELVLAAAKDNNLTPGEWNALPQAQRDEFINNELQDRIAFAAKAAKDAEEAAETEE